MTGSREEAAAPAGDDPLPEFEPSGGLARGRKRPAEASNPTQAAISRLTAPVLAAVLALVAIWFIAKEAIEPHWVIRFGDLLRPGPPPVVLPLDAGMALHFYADTRPHIGKITPVQKGGVLALDDEELVEEGYGFGAPIVIYEGRSYLSQHAEIAQVGAGAPAAADQRGGQLVKRFRIDVEDSWTQLFRRKYRAVPPLGTIVFTYTVSAPGVLDVAVDFSGLNVQPELVYLANEQGARPFTRYSDSSGADRPFDDRPDTPDQWIPTTADIVCLVSPVRRVRFCVESPAGQNKYVGRERYFQLRWSGLFRLSWAGNDLELGRPTGVYRYRITVERLI